jgi:hypothetical protein
MAISVVIAPTPNFTLIPSPLSKSAEKPNWLVSVSCVESMVRNVWVEISGTSSKLLPLPCALATLSRTPIVAVGTLPPQ